MKENIKSFTVFLTVLLVSIFAVAAIMGQALPSLIEVKGTQVQTTDNTTQDITGLLASEATLNDYENAVAALINSYRASNGVAPVAYSGKLTYVAKLRSQDLLDRDYFSHYTPEGNTVFNIMREAGISFSRAGENLGHARPADIGSPEAFLDAWAKSPSHNANMLRDVYGKIGVGMVENGDRIVVTTVFTN
ncbi:MAG: hypothetical protein FJW66_04750 [Actinobacteria bacterium]|nr:hypothetical protein [Actinomycetota bacterium]